MSSISDIFKSYKTALTGSRSTYNELYADRAENGKVFYDKFFRRLTIDFSSVFSNTTSRSFITRQIERAFGTTEIDFVAVDGTCQKDPFNDFVVFFGGAYGAKGRASLQGDPARVKYQKWEMNRDVSMVAWIPIPFAQLSDVTNAEETFLVSDSDKVNLAGIHTGLMQLAEIYLAYNVAVGSSIDAPKLIMLDQAMSGIMAASSHGVDTGLTGYPHDRRALDARDVTIAFAHPFNDELRVPSNKRFRRYTAVLADFHRRGTRTLSLDELSKDLQLDRAELLEPIKYLESKDIKLGKLDPARDVVELEVDVRESWEYTKSLFQNICSRLFLKKEQTALMYEKPDSDDPSKTRRAWMAPDDINFLIAVGLRALIEACWAKRILLVGIVKDSESRYLTRNYLGVMKKLGIYPELQKDSFGLLPWTDRIFLETIPTYCDDDIGAPWSSIEFDSAFMTLHLGPVSGREEIMGVKTRGGEIISTERLFMRSLAQFYLSRSKPNPLMGHVVFVDRLVYPMWDSKNLLEPPITGTSLGSIQPIMFADRDQANVGQLVTMFLLSVLTRNHFPEVIGYPDPLHKADWGAKSIGRRVKGVIQSSELPFRSQPISRTLRSIRDGKGRK